MGVDYDANFGIGIEVEEIDFEGNERFFDMEEYLDSLLSGTDYVYTSYGQGSYTRESDTYIIILNNPFKDGYDLTNKILEMEQFLKSNNIDFEKIDLVGGLLVW